MKRRIIMFLAAVAAIFATENIIDTLVNRYAPTSVEILTWMIIAAVSAVVIYEVGEDRGDW